MKRYAISGTITRVIDTDVLIVGSGIAGLYSALNIDRRLNVTILTKESVDLSNSWLAQGGIAAAIKEYDTPAAHYDDTQEAGAELCDPEATKVLVSEGPGAVESLWRLNVPFDLNAEGDLMVTREGGHHMNRIVHAGGDATGRETVKVLAPLVFAEKNVTAAEKSTLADVITEGGSVCGAIVIDDCEELVFYRTSSVIIATGGIGQIYLTSTNPHVATGDGLAAAIRAGAEMKDLEFVQFHPTGLYDRTGEYGSRAFLISEAMRGEGALLKNSKGERFMSAQHELGELAPRDIVARGILREMEKNGDTNEYLDITHKPREFLESRFPTIFGECLKRGIDISKEWIPVAPVQHYMMGGIRTDVDAKTSIEGLYAVGEAACTGVHGANRLASNSMLECLVFGKRAAKSINVRHKT
ncbi:MAG: L-aspartate oxidase, partial [Oscillospiraceae bacterium]|nr:L-aspartate oxidase [Oscillospiraceae bacterium]